MRAAEENARARGVKRLWLEVLVQNEPAIELYEKLGYAHVRDLEVWSLDGELVFQKHKVPSVPVADAVGRSDEPAALAARGRDGRRTSPTRRARGRRAGRSIYRSTPAGSRRSAGSRPTTRTRSASCSARSRTRPRGVWLLNGPEGDPVNAVLESLGGTQIGAPARDGARALTATRRTTAGARAGGWPSRAPGRASRRPQSASRGRGTPRHGRRRSSPTMQPRCVQRADRTCSRPPSSRYAATCLRPTRATVPSPGASASIASRPSRRRTRSRKNTIPTRPFSFANEDADRRTSRRWASYSPACSFARPRIESVRNSAARVPLVIPHLANPVATSTRSSRRRSRPM